MTPAAAAAFAERLVAAGNARDLETALAQSRRRREAISGAPRPMYGAPR